MECSPRQPPRNENKIERPVAVVSMHDKLILNFVPIVIFGSFFQAPYNILSCPCCPTWATQTKLQHSAGTYLEWKEDRIGAFDVVISMHDKLIFWISFVLQFSFVFQVPYNKQSFPSILSFFLSWCWCWNDRLKRSYSTSTVRVLTSSLLLCLWNHSSWRTIDTLPK